MVQDSDEDRVRRKAHQLWEAEGRPHGRDEDHWVQAREIVAIEDSQGDTLLPRDFGADEPVENAEMALRNLADFPNLTDQGENLLTSTDRENVGMPSIEVPTSDQPGIPQRTEPPSKSASSSPGVGSAKPRTTSIPKNAGPEKAKSTGKAATPKKK